MIVTLLGKKASVVRTAYAKVLHAAFLYTNIGLEPASALDSAAGQWLQRYAILLVIPMQIGTEGVEERSVKLH